MSAQTKPRCEDCGKVTDRCIRRHPHGVIAGSLFLCADCARQLNAAPCVRVSAQIFMSWLTGGTRKPGLFRSWPDACLFLGLTAFCGFVVGAAVYGLVTL